MSETQPSPSPSLAAATRYWLRLGLTSFGGPAGQIAMMQTDLVDRRGWIDQRRFLGALNFCMLLPGPEAQQLATFVGWRLHGTIGGLIAGTLFIVPGALVLFGLSYLAAAHGDAALVASIFAGIQPVVVGVIAVALWRIGRRVLKSVTAAAIAVAAFAALSVLGLPFPLLIGVAALLGIVLDRAGVATFAHVQEGPAQPWPKQGLRHLLRLAALFVALWAVPVALVLWALGADPFAGIVRLFTTAAFVTFGGAYAVLPYIAEAAVETYGWLGPSDMIRGLALAETTPGPLILVTQFVGFFAGWTQSAGLDPLFAAAVGSVLTLYVTFLPCFFFIFAGARWVDTLIHSRLCSAALTAVTAAIVGVIADLGVFIAQATWFSDGGALDPGSVLITLLATIALLATKVGVHWVVVAGAVLGAVSV